MTDVRSTPEYRELLARVQYLNGLVARLGGLADDLATRSGTVEHAEVAEWLNTALDGTDQPTPPASGQLPATTPEEA